MSGSRPNRRSQGTDMLENLRFPDAIEFGEVLKHCNRLARPIGNRSVTNNCYILLLKATYFSSSVFIGIKHVQDTLVALRDDPVPCLVIFAADTFITAEMTDIVHNCKSRDIPYIYIPNKRSIRDALSVDNDVLAVLIAFNHDPGMRKEFEDCFVSMRNLCFRKKRKREPNIRETPFFHLLSVTPTLALPPEVGPRDEMPQQVTIEVSTVEPGTSSSFDWATISSDSDFSDDSDLDKGTSRDFSVNVPDESGSTFQEYVRIPSPTPAPSPSEMAAQHKYNQSYTAGETATACSSEESLTSGPRQEFAVPIVPPRPHHCPHRQATWPIALPYAPKEEYDNEKVKMYLQTICGRKKLRLRSKTSVPPMCTTQQPPLGQDYGQFVTRPLPLTTTQTPASQPTDIEVDDIPLCWTMDDLSSTSNEAMVDVTTRPMIDPQAVHAIQNEGASGDGNICGVDLSESSSAVSIATPELPTASSFMNLSDVYPSTAFGYGDNDAITSNSSRVDIQAPMASFHGSGDVCVLPSSRTLAEAQPTPSVPAQSDVSSGEVGDVRSIPSPPGVDDLRAVPSLRAMGDAQPIPSLRELGDLLRIPPFRGLQEVPSIPSFRGLDNDSTSSSEELNGIHSASSFQGEIVPIPPFRRLVEAPSNSTFRALDVVPSASAFRGLGAIPPIPPFRRSGNVPSISSSSELATARSRDVSIMSSFPGAGVSQASSSEIINNIHASTSTSGRSDAPAVAPPFDAVGDVPAVPAVSGEVGDAAVVPIRAQAERSSGQMGMSSPSAFGDAWPMGVLNPNVFRHRVTGTGEGHQRAVMPTNLGYAFAPRIFYTAATNENGRMGLWNNPPEGIPREEDILAIPLPGEEDNASGEGANSVSNSMETNRADDDFSDESELSSDDSVGPPSPFEFKE